MTNETVVESDGTVVLPTPRSGWGVSGLFLLSGLMSSSQRESSTLRLTTRGGLWPCLT